MTTIYHECLHCCDGCMCHTGKWKEYAEIVNKRFGTQIQRCTSRNEKLCAEIINEERVKKESNLKEYKWKWTLTSIPIKGVVSGDLFIKDHGESEEPFIVAEINQTIGSTAVDRLTW